MNRQSEPIYLLSGVALFAYFSDSVDHRLISSSLIIGKKRENHIQIDPIDRSRTTIKLTTTTKRPTPWQNILSMVDKTICRLKLCKKFSHFDHLHLSISIASCKLNN